ncbi:hypothetical protein Tco_1355814 [Tanacetum coccineum]
MKQDGNKKDQNWMIIKRGRRLQRYDLQLIMCGDKVKDSSSYLKLRGSIEDFVSFREMITSQLQEKLWLYDKVHRDQQQSGLEFEAPEEEGCCVGVHVCYSKKKKVVEYHDTRSSMSRRSNNREYDSNEHDMVMYLEVVISVAKS